MNPSPIPSARLGLRLSALLACVSTCLAAPTPALAWGAHGHRIATRVAEARLTPGTTPRFRTRFNGRYLWLNIKIPNRNPAAKNACF